MKIYKREFFLNWSSFIFNLNQWIGSDNQRKNGATSNTNEFGYLFWQQLTVVEPKRIIHTLRPLAVFNDVFSDVHQNTVTIGSSDCPVTVHVSVINQNHLKICLLSYTDVILLSKYILYNSNHHNLVYSLSSKHFHLYRMYNI